MSSRVRPLLSRGMSQQEQAAGQFMSAASLCASGVSDTYECNAGNTVRCTPSAHSAAKPVWLRRFSSPNTRSWHRSNTRALAMRHAALLRSVAFSAARGRGARAYVGTRRQLPAIR
jgi:hypothetical protein